MSITIHCYQATRAKAERNAELLRRFGGDPPPPEVLFSTLDAWLVTSPAGRDVTKPVGSATWDTKYDEKKGGYNAIVPHSPEELEYCKQQAAQLPEDTILVGMVPAAARKAFILITGIVWEGAVPAQKDYEVPV